jgi:hypothetical protein
VLYTAVNCQSGGSSPRVLIAECNFYGRAERGGLLDCRGLEQAGGRGSCEGGERHRPYEGYDIQAEMVIVDAPLGDDGTHVEVVEAHADHVVGGEASTPESPGGICLDLAVCGPGPTQPRSQALGEEVHAPGSMSMVHPGVIELGLPGYLGAPPPPVSWRHVEANAKQVCSWVATMDRLLLEAMAMVGRDILHPIWVS